MRRNLSQFPVEFFELLDRAASKTVTVECSTIERARSLLARFNTFRSALYRSDADEAQKVLARSICARVCGTCVEFAPRSDTWEAKLIREALEMEEERK